MEKKNSFGFKTPVRRTTKNLTGYKVGGNLTGGECELISTKLLKLKDSNKYNFLINPKSSIGLFNSNIGIVAVGGYFICDSDMEIILSFEINKESSTKKYDIEKNRFYAVGHDYEIDLEEQIENIAVSVEFV